MSAPAVAPMKPNMTTSRIEWCRATAQPAAPRRSTSPGNGMPTLSTRMPSPAAGSPRASTIVVGSTGLHILDDRMAEYGEHEATDDPLQVLRHSAAHLLAAAVTELYPDAK